LLAVTTLLGWPSVGKFQAGRASSTLERQLGVKTRQGCLLRSRRRLDDVCVDHRVVFNNGMRVTPRPRDFTIRQRQHTLISLPKGLFRIFIGKAAVCYAGLDEHGVLA